MEIDTLIIGAGIVGLSLAEAITRKYPELEVVLLERHFKFGQEISSRNSEVIHAGIYYGNAPEKARYCKMGRDALYRFCADQDIPYLRCGKYLVASSDVQVEKLLEIKKSASENGVSLAEVPPSEIRNLLDNPSLVYALWSESTGIVDSHSLLSRLETLAAGQGTTFMYGHEFLDVLEKSSRGSLVSIRDPEGQIHKVLARKVFNAAGLNSARIANLFLERQDLQMRPCRGRYFSMASRWDRKFSSLIYPVPDPLGGLGVHLTIDLGGKCRLGPDVHWPEMSPGQSADDPLWNRFEADSRELQESFLIAGRKLLPKLEFQDLAPDYVGVRPKLFIGESLYTDFLNLKGNSGDSHFLGIESPGLTAALAIADEASSQLGQLGQLAQLN